MGDFPTKIGACRVDEQGLHLSQTGWRGGLARVLYGQSMARAYALYGLAVVFLIGVGIRDLMDKSPWAVTALVGAAVMLRAMWQGRDLSATLFVPRDSIRGILAHPPQRWKRGFFEVYFRQGDRDRRRLVMLPSGADLDVARGVLEGLGKPIRDA